MWFPWGGMGGGGTKLEDSKLLMCNYSQTGRRIFFKNINDVTTVAKLLTFLIDLMTFQTLLAT